MKEVYVIRSMIFNAYWNIEDEFVLYINCSQYETIIEAMTVIMVDIKEDCEIVKVYIP